MGKTVKAKAIINGFRWWQIFQRRRYNKWIREATPKGFNEVDE